MILTIDIGNTNVLMGLFDRGKLLHHWRLVSTIQRTSDEWGSLIVLQLQRVNLTPSDVAGVIISSVVPLHDFPFSCMALDYFQIEPIFVCAELDLGISIKYKQPEHVGADRLCNAVAAVQKFSTPIIVIDFGTATTFDIINKEGEYLGGIIAPGIETAASILHRQAAKLPVVGMSFPEKVIGQTTESSIQSGILYGALVETEGLIKRIEDELGFPAEIVGTGGFAPLLSQHTTVIKHIEPFLTLEGLYIIYQRINHS